MEKLRELQLGGNKLTRLGSLQFPPLHHLQTLKLDNCNIKYVHDTAFSNLPNITTLGFVFGALIIIINSVPVALPTEFEEFTKVS